MSNRFLSILQQFGGRIFISGILLFTVLGLVGYLANSINFEEQFRALPFTTAADAIWYHGPIGFVLLGTAAICISCPRQIVSFFAAYFFGLWLGVVVALSAAVCSCILTFSFSRIFSAKVQGWITGKLDIAIRFWKDNAFLGTMIWRFLPAGSNLLTNLTAGAIGIPAAGFIAGSAIGYIPQTIIFAVLGSGIKLESGTQLIVSGMLFAISAILGLWLFSRYRGKLLNGVSD